MKDDKIIGGNSKVKVVKTRFGPPYGECIIPIYYFDYNPEPIDLIFDLARSNQVKLVKKYKEDFKYMDLKIAGEENFKLALKEAKDEKGKSYIEILIDEMKELASKDEKIKIHPSILEWTPEKKEEVKNGESKDGK